MVVDRRALDRRCPSSDRTEIAMLRSTQRGEIKMSAETNEREQKTAEITKNRAD